MPNLTRRRGLLGSASIWVALLALAAVAYLAAHMARADLHPGDADWPLALGTLPVVVVAYALATLAFGLHRWLPRHFSIIDLGAIAKTASAASLVLVGATLAGRAAGVAAAEHLALGVLVMQWAATLLLYAAFGLLARGRGERRARAIRDAEAPERVLIVGAGVAGADLARQMLHNPAFELRPVAFADDAPAKRGARLAGLPIRGPVADVPELAREFAVDRLIIAIPSASPDQLRQIVAACQPAGLPLQTLPPLPELLRGRLTISRVRDVDIADLLGRPVARLDEGAIRASLAGRRVLVTGAGGSVGSELARQIARFEPAALILVDRAENPLFDIERELRNAAPAFEVTARVLDVTQRDQLRRLLDERRPSVVFHAAAHKHVPLMEDVPGEAVRNNIGGTLALAEAAEEAGVERLVLISTDKAVDPSSVMGATKRVCEHIVAELSRGGRTRFMSVRFGNVLGSSGSVVPLFREQIERGGPVTVTDERMTRYFMALPEAAALVLEAGAVGRSGETYLLDMGEPVRIVTLAETLIRLSGFEPYTEIAIEFAGARPGEKLTERLSYDAEEFERAGHDKLLVAREDAARPALLAQVRALLEELPSLDAPAVRRRLDALAGANGSLDGSAAVRDVGAEAALPGAVADAEATGLSPSGEASEFRAGA